MPRTTRVRDLRAAQVISMPSTGLGLSVIAGISEPMGDVRFIFLDDLETGLSRESRYVLGLDREVEVHCITVAHHWYTNVSEASIELTLGNRQRTVAPGETIHYTGEAHEDRFDVSFWDHHVELIEVVHEAPPAE